MEINGPPPITLTPRQTQATLGAWRIGQVLQAQVVKQASPQAVILQVGNQQLLAETNVLLNAGQRLELTVNQLGEKPILQARLLNSPAMPQGTTGSSAGTTATSGREAPQATAPQTATSQTAPLTGRSGALPPQAATATLLKQALPKQAGMAGLLANIAQLNNYPGRTASLPAPVEAIIKQLYRQLPSADKIGNAQQLKQNIANSGVFLENRLNKAAADKSASRSTPMPQANAQLPTGKPGATPAAPGTGTDLKATLLRLLSTIQKVSRTAAPQTAPTRPPGTVPAPLQPLPFTPPPLRGQPPQPQAKAEATVQQLGTLSLLLLELGRQTEAALARTQLHQAASLPGGEQNINSLALELPLRNGHQVDLFDMVIEEEQPEQQDDDNAHPWSISLAFDLDGLGPVYARLRLINDKISTLFWADRPETMQLFNQHLNELSQRYREAGLETGELRCFQGPPPEAEGSKTPHIVLDVKA